MLKQYGGFPAGVFVATDVSEQLERMRRVVEETDKEKESIRYEAIHLKKALDSALRHNEELTIALMEADKEFVSLDVPQIEQVVYSGPKTIIMWQDGTKTMVSLAMTSRETIMPHFVPLSSRRCSVLLTKRRSSWRAFVRTR